MLWGNIAPEVIAPVMLALQDSPYEGEAADAWSCGVFLYVLLFCRSATELTHFPGVVHSSAAAACDAANLGIQPVVTKPFSAAMGQPINALWKMMCFRFLLARWPCLLLYAVILRHKSSRLSLDFS